MRGKYFSGIIIILIITSLTACLNPQEKEKPIVNNPSNLSTRLTEEEQDILMREYKDLSEIENNKSKIIDFVDDNIEHLGIENASIIVLDLSEYLEAHNYPVYESYILLNRYKKHVSLETKSYINMYYTEASNPFTDGDKVTIDLQRLGARALVAEDHLKMFSNGITRDRIFTLYKEYIEGLINHIKNPYILINKSSLRLNDETLEAYETIISNGEASKTSSILSEYMELLGKNNNKINSKDIKDFINGLDTIISGEFNIKDLSR